MNILFIVTCETARQTCGIGLINNSSFFIECIHLELIDVRRAQLKQNDSSEPG